MSGPISLFEWFGPWRPGTFEEQVEQANRWFLSEARTFAHPQERLWVARIEYGSPGSIDLLGVGMVCKELANAIRRSVTFFAERELRRERVNQAKLETRKKELALESQEESIRALKLKNAQSILQIRRDILELRDDALLHLAVSDQDKILRLISEKKLVGAKSVEDEPPERDKAA